jgi:hypothetical protein
MKPSREDLVSMTLNEFISQNARKGVYTMGPVNWSQAMREARALDALEPWTCPYCGKGEPEAACKMCKPF